MKITDKCAAQGDQTIYISDFTPLKSAVAGDSLKHTQELEADYIWIIGVNLRSPEFILATGINSGVRLSLHL